MRREGFLLVWAAAALAIVMTLGAGVFLSCPWRQSRRQKGKFPLMKR